MNPQKIWTYSEPDRETCGRIAQKFSFHPAIAAVLHNRGIRTDSQVERFLRAGVEALYDPFLMKDMDKAVDRILKAVTRDEKIAIYGDFDVDGLTSMHILGRFLSSLGTECTYYVPNRLVEGYGLSQDGITKCHSEGATLLLTVDCGISSVKEIAYARSLGLDAIVADHHEPEPILPQCCAVIDPKRPDCTYPFSELAGVGVVYKLCRAVLEKLPDLSELPTRPVPGPQQTPADVLQKMMDMVALGTVADLAPLVDENRLLVKAGLHELERTQNVGLQELKSVCNVDRHVTSYDIAFRIAPRLNAAGRMGNAESALRLLNSEDEREAYNLASIMEQSNRDRQKTEQKILSQAERQILHEVDLLFGRCIVVHSENWHQGVTGIVASRLTKQYHRPTIIVSVEGDTGRGTARSIPEFHLLDGLRECRDLLTTFGGHRLAAGFEIRVDNIPAFKRRFEEITAQKLSSADITPKISVDALIDIAEINRSFVTSLRILEPFGEANRQPIFVSRGLFQKSAPMVVGRRHLKVLVDGPDGPLDAIGFDMADQIGDLRDTSRPFDLAYIPRMNSYKGTENIQLVIKDFKPTDS